MGLYSLNEMENLSKVLGDSSEKRCPSWNFKPLKSIQCLKQEETTTYVYQTDFGELGTQTLSNLTSFRMIPILYGQVKSSFGVAKSFIKRCCPEPHCYANPECLIVSPSADKLFISKVYEYRKSWNRRCRDSLGTSNPFVPCTKKERHLMKQLVSTGVLFLDRKHCDPSRWPKHLEGVQAGDRFGRLTVIRSLTDKKYACICECGRSTKVRRSEVAQTSWARQHLILRSWKRILWSPYGRTEVKIKKARATNLHKGV